VQGRFGNWASILFAEDSRPRKIKGGVILLEQQAFQHDHQELLSILISLYILHSRPSTGLSFFQILKKMTAEPLTNVR
jgi:hypothetical protein